MNTSLSLLTREGAIMVTFAAVLTTTQYAKLYESVIECDTKQQLRDCIAMVANEWAIVVIIDDG